MHLNHAIAIIAPLAVALALTSCGDSVAGPDAVSAHYTITAISDTTVRIRGFNNSGQIVGIFHDGQHPTNALISQGTTIDLGTCVPAGLNDDGTVLCGTTLWNAGTVTPISIPNGIGLSVNGLNDDGLVGGIAIGQSETDPCQFPGCAYLGTSASATLVAPPAGVNSILQPRMDNGSFVLVQWNWPATDSLEIVEVHQDSTTTAYPCAGLPSDHVLTAIGGDNEVVGQNGTPDAFVCKDGIMQSLGAETSAANDISHSGFIVGTTDDGHGFLWDNGKLTILNGGLYGEGWYVSSADRVNDAGQIIVTASNGSGRSETLLLTPK